MSRNQALETEASWTTRCGRCADILPDETMTFCPQCGIPFSRVPPTIEFVPFREHAEELATRRRQRQVAFRGVLLFAAFWLLAWGVGRFENAAAIRDLHAVRELVIYTYDMPDFPALDSGTRRAAIAVATQAFEDHFGVGLANIKIYENQLPPTLEASFRRKWDDRLSQLSLWEKQMLLNFAADWHTSLSSPLPIIITNIPVLVDNRASPGMETRHLSSTGLIAGIGSPGFVFVSTFRMLTQAPEFLSAKPALRNNTERARYLGEYLLAHELGHALLGLADYVIETPAAPAGKAGLRAPASVQTSISTADCLMHTDAGGGFAAWASLRDRTLGQKAVCPNYASIMEAYRLRGAAITELQQGHRAAAEKLHAQAGELMQSDATPWMRELWRAEHHIFLSDLQRWLPSDSMFQ